VTGDTQRCGSALTISSPSFLSSTRITMASRVKAQKRARLSPDAHDESPAEDVEDSPESGSGDEENSGSEDDRSDEEIERMNRASTQKPKKSKCQTLLLLSFRQRVPSLIDRLTICYFTQNGNVPCRPKLLELSSPAS
jgi:hypothetical protein